MPEGPSIVILKEAVQSFKGRKILSVSGNSYQIDKERLTNQKVTSFKSWGKHFLICLPHYTIRIHTIQSLPPRKLTELINEARNYSYDFLAWKKAFVLKKHWLIHTKKTCPRCNIPVIKKHLGKTNRRTFYCVNCQLLYKKTKKATRTVKHQ